MWYVNIRCLHRVHDTVQTFSGVLRFRWFFFNKDTWELLHLDNISREINILSYKKNSAYSFGKRHTILLLIKKKERRFGRTDVR